LGWLKLDNIDIDRLSPGSVTRDIYFTLVPAAKRGFNIVAFPSDVLEQMFEVSGEFIEGRLSRFKETINSLLKSNTITIPVFIVEDHGQKDRLKDKIEHLNRALGKKRLIKELFIVVVEDSYAFHYQFGGLLTKEFPQFYDFSRMTKAYDVITHRQLIQAIVDQTLEAAKYNRK